MEDERALCGVSSNEWMLLVHRLALCHFLNSLWRAWYVTDVGWLLEEARYMPWAQTTEEGGYEQRKPSRVLER